VGTDASCNYHPPHPHPHPTHTAPFLLQTKQETNEFVVLNAGAYHAGYNTGFNCAEAVNFATDDWLQIGKAVQRCKCGALKDGVRISMRSFGLSDSSDSSAEDSDEVSRAGLGLCSVSYTSLPFGGRHSMQRFMPAPSLRQV
jgi:hypothetical protein